MNPVIADKVSESGIAFQTPVCPNRASKMYSDGIKYMHCLSAESIDALNLARVA